MMSMNHSNPNADAANELYQKADPRNSTRPEAESKIISALEEQNEEETKHSCSLTEVFSSEDVESHTTFQPNGSYVDASNVFQSIRKPKKQIRQIELSEFAALDAELEAKKKRSGKTIGKIMINLSLRRKTNKKKKLMYEDTETEAHVGIFSEDPEVVKMRLKLGADPNLHDDLGFTPLMRAVLRGGNKAKKTIKHLLDHPQTDVNQRHIYSQHGYTALHYACMATPSVTLKMSDNLTDMFEPKCVNGFLGGVKALLKSEKINPNLKDETVGGTCLHHAACHDYFKIIKAVLSHKATDPNVQMKNGNTPLLVAQFLKYKRSQIVLLKDKRTNFRIKNHKLDSYQVITTDKEILKIIANK